MYLQIPIVSLRYYFKIYVGHLHFFWLLHVILFNYWVLFVYLIWNWSYWEREETEKDIFYPLVHSPSGCISQGGARPKPGVVSRSPTWVAWDQAFGLSCAAFPRPLVELDQKWGGWDTNWHPCGMLALQVAAPHATPQCQPLINGFYEKAVSKSPLYVLQKLSLALPFYSI